MQEVLVSKIFNYPSTPTKNVEGQFWFNPSTNVLSRFNGTIWKPITVSSDDVAVLTDGSKVSLTSYLNTQIAALAEGIDSKQDKLLYYSEVSGGVPSATIFANNIKLAGSVAEGFNAAASGYSSHAEGSSTTASGNYSHAEGDNTKAQFPYSHAEGQGTTASGQGSHAEGQGTTASGNYSHAEGIRATASGSYSHAEGSTTTASGVCSHAEGFRTTASINFSHAEGSNTIASSNYQHAQGKYNIEDVNDKYADIIGNGSGVSARSNAATVSWEGISWSQTDVRAGGTDQDSATHSLAAKQNATDNSLETTDKTIVGAINELSADKQNTLKYYSESDSSTEPSSNNAQVSILKSSDYQTTLNLGFESSNGLQTVNIGGSSNDRRINIGTKTCGQYNNVTIGNASDGVLLTLNTGRGLAGTGVTKDLSTSATDAQFPTAAAVNNQLILKQNITDNTLTTADKTIVGAINEINSIFNVNTLLAPITDVKTITTTLENLITDTQYANKPGTILINPAITNTGAILVGEAITDISKAFPIYTDQPVTIAFKNINDFKVAGNITGDKFNYIVSFGYIGNTNIVSNNLKITTTNGIYEITPEGDSGSTTLKISKIS